MKRTPASIDTMDMVVVLSGIGTPETTAPRVIIPLKRVTANIGRTGEEQSSSERGEATKVNP